MNHKSERRLILLLSTIQFLHILDFVVIMPLGPMLIRLLKIRPNEFSYLVSSYTFSAAFAGLILFYFIDIVSRKKLLLSVFFIFSCATFACGLANSFYALLTARIFAGASGGILNGLILTMVVDHIPNERRGSANAKIMSSFSLAAIFGLPIGIWISQTFNWKFLFFILSTLSFGLFFILLKYIPTEIEAQKKPNINDDLKKSWNFFYPISITFFISLASYTVLPYISLSLVKNANLPENMLKIVYFFAGVFTYFTSRFVGWSLDRFDRKKIFYLILIFSIPTTMIITHLTSLSVSFTAILLSLFMALNSARMIPLLTIISINLPKEIKGRFMSLNAVTQQIAAGLGALIVSNIVFIRSDDRLHFFGYAGYTSCLFVFLAIFFCHRLLK